MLMRSDPEAARAPARARPGRRRRALALLHAARRPRAQRDGASGRRHAAGPAAPPRARRSEPCPISHPLPRPRAAHAARRLVVAAHRERSTRCAASRTPGVAAVVLPVALRGGDHRASRSRCTARSRPAPGPSPRRSTTSPSAPRYETGPDALPRARRRGEARAPRARDREPERRHARRLARARAPRRGGRRRRARAQPLPGGRRPGALQRGARGARPRARGGGPRGDPRSRSRSSSRPTSPRSRTSRAGVVEAGADGLVLFNRFYQPDLDLETLEVTPHLVLSSSHELRLPLRWIGDPARPRGGVARGHLRACTAPRTC